MANVAVFYRGIVFDERFAVGRGQRPTGR